MSRYDILLNDPKKEPPPKEHSPASANPPPKQSTDEATGRPPDQNTIRPPDRATGDYELIRRGFDWWAYQLRTLKKLSLKEQLEGKPGSMSAMVREALDDYFKKRAGDL
jgi:hypothetical protein